MSSKTKTTATKEEATPTLVPILRFPEFRETAGWDVEYLGGICQPQQWTTISSTNLVDRGYPVYGANGFIGYYTDFNHEFEAVAVTCRGSTCGEVTLIPPKSYITGNSMCLDGIDAVQNSYHFVYQLLKHRGFADVISGSAQPQIVGNAIKRLRIALPKKPEQQKIAECLGSLDELMAAQARKVDALKTHKKGLMQQLFPREGETQPRLRFPEFQSAGGWEENHLGDYFDPIRNGFVGTATPFYTTTKGVPYLQGRNIKQGRIDADNLVFISSEFHSRQRKSHLKTGDILMVQSGHVGECAVVGPDFAKANCHALVILTPKQKLSSEFFAHYFYSPIGELAIFQITTGNTIKHILASELKTLPVLVPDLAEQQRIASCLTSLDARMTAETQQLEALKTHKKGLMQQLFPSTEAAEA